MEVYLDGNWFGSMVLAFCCRRFWVIKLFDDLDRYVLVQVEKEKQKNFAFKEEFGFVLLRCMYLSKSCYLPESPNASRPEAQLK